MTENVVLDSENLGIDHITTSHVTLNVLSCETGYSFVTFVAGPGACGGIAKGKIKYFKRTGCKRF